MGGACSPSVWPQGGPWLDWLWEGGDGDAQMAQALQPDGRRPQVAGLLRPWAGGRWRGWLRNSNTPKSWRANSTLRDESEAPMFPRAPHFQPKDIAG